MPHREIELRRKRLSVHALRLSLIVELLARLARLTCSRLIAGRHLAEGVLDVDVRLVRAVGFRVVNQEKHR